MSYLAHRSSRGGDDARIPRESDIIANVSVTYMLTRWPFGEKERTPITVPHSSTSRPPLPPILTGALCSTMRPLMTCVSLSAVLVAMWMRDTAN